MFEIDNIQNQSTQMASSIKPTELKLKAKLSQAKEKPTEAPQPVKNSKEFVSIRRRLEEMLGKSRARKQGMVSSSVDILGSTGQLFSDSSPALNFATLNNSAANLQANASFDGGLSPSFVINTNMSLPSISPRVGSLDPILTKDSIERSLAEFKLKKNLRAQGLFVNDSSADLTLKEPDSLRRYAEDSLPALTERKPSYKSGGDKIYQAARALTKTLSDYTAEQSILEEKTRALESHIRDVQQFLVGND